jgi:hypothetical protein
LHARGSRPPSSLIAPPTEVEGDLERAMTDLTADKPAAPRHDLAAKHVAPAADVPPRGPTAAYDTPPPSEPEISIERLEDAAQHDDAVSDARVVEVLKDTSSQKITLSVDRSDPEIVVEPLVAADSGPQPRRPRRPTDAPE